jgi:hypothetical protein
MDSESLPVEWADWALEPGKINTSRLARSSGWIATATLTFRTREDRQETLLLEHQIVANAEHHARHSKLRIKPS